MAVTYTVKPAGGGDYTTLQAAYDFIDGESANDFTLECYSGGNLAELFDGNPLASGSTLTINVASGHEHNGDLSSGAYASTTSDYTYVIYFLNIGCEVTISGLRLKQDATDVAGGIEVDASDANNHNILIEKCLIQMVASVGGSYPGIYLYPYDLTSNPTYTIRNNIITTDMPGGGNYTYGMYIQVYCDAVSYTLNQNIYNNTITNCSTNGIFIERYSGGASTLNVNVNLRNNVAVDSTVSDFGSSDSGTGTLTITSSNNASSDSTADDFGGSNHLLSRVAADEFTNPDSDWRLKGGNSLITAGYDLSGSFTNDAYGNTRAVPFSIGAWEGSAPNKQYIVKQAVKRASFI